MPRKPTPQELQDYLEVILHPQKGPLAKVPDGYPKSTVVFRVTKRDIFDVGASGNAGLIFDPAKINSLGWISYESNVATTSTSFSWGTLYNPDRTTIQARFSSLRLVAAGLKVRSIQATTADGGVHMVLYGQDGYVMSTIDQILANSEPTGCARIGEPLSCIWTPLDNSDEEFYVQSSDIIDHGTIQWAATGCAANAKFLVEYTAVYEAVPYPNDLNDGSSHTEPTGLMQWARRAMEGISAAGRLMTSKEFKEGALNVATLLKGVKVLA